MSNETTFKVVSEIRQPFVTIRKDILLAIESHFDLAVYVHLLRYVNYNTQECYPSLNRLVKESKMSKDRLLKSIKSLEEGGFISVYRQHNKSNIYRITEPNLGSPSDRPPAEVVRQADLSGTSHGLGSPSDRPQEVRENDPNKNNKQELMNKNNLNISKLKNDKQYQEDWLKSELVKYKDKYDSDLLREFYAHYTRVDDVRGETELTAQLRKRNNRFSVSGTLATWQKNRDARGFKSKSPAMSFQEQDRSRIQENLKFAQDFSRSRNLNTINDKGELIDG